MVGDLIYMDKKPSERIQEIYQKIPTVNQDYNFARIEAVIKYLDELADMKSAKPS
jgi:hypothetical protein